MSNRPDCRDCKHIARYSDEIDGCRHPRVAYQGVKNVVGFEVGACRMLVEKCGPAGKWFEPKP